MLVGKEHVALITGGSGGLGAATAKRLLDMGGRVGVLDRDEDGLAALVASTGAADRLHVFPCDVSNEESVAAGVESCVRTFGCIHAAVQCAGIVSYSQTLDAEGNSIDMKKFDETMKCNTYGALHLAKYAAIAMSKNVPDERNMRGCILFTTSICATEGLAQSLAYSASKAAINGMVLPMARDLSHAGIRVNAIAPGTIPTEMQLSGIRNGYGATTPEAIRDFQEKFILRYYPEGADQGTAEDCESAPEAQASAPGRRVRVQTQARVRPPVSVFCPHFPRSCSQSRTLCTRASTTTSSTAPCSASTAPCACEANAGRVATAAQISAVFTVHAYSSYICTKN